MGPNTPHSWGRGGSGAAWELWVWVSRNWGFPALNQRPESQLDEYSLQALKSSLLAWFQVS